MMHSARTSCLPVNSRPLITGMKKKCRRYLNPEQLVHILCLSKSNLTHVTERHDGIVSLLGAATKLEKPNSVVYDKACDLSTSKMRVDFIVE